MDRIREVVAASMLTLVPVFASAQEMMMPGQDHRLDLSREAVFEAGALEGEEWEVFGTIDGLSFDASGNLYVLDGQNVRVVVLDPSGNHVRSFGRKGGGPGEFQMPGGMALTPEGQVVVYDAARSSYTILDSEGEYVGSMRSDMMSVGGRPSGGGAMGGNLVGHPSGGFLSEYRGFDIDTGDPDTSTNNGSALPVRLYPATDGAEGTELFKGTFQGPPATLVARPGEQSMRMGAPPAFTPVFRWGVLPSGGAAYMDGVEYEVRLTGADGGPAGVLRRPIDPREVSSRDEQEEKARRLEAMESTGAGAPIRVEVVNGARSQSADLEMGRRLIEQLQFADRVPVLSDLAVDGGGLVWVQRSGARPGEAGPVDVLTVGGEYLGTTELESLPTAFGPDGLAAWVETGEFGVMTVRVERLALGTR